MRPTMRGEGRARTVTAAELAQLPARLEARPFLGAGFAWEDVVRYAWLMDRTQGARTFTAGTVADAGRVRALRARYACGYCGEAPATGYVRAYRTRVCEPCFHDQHGGGDA